MSVDLALPYKINEENSTSYIGIYSRNWQHIASIPRAKDIENARGRAEFIKLACNSHHDLVESLINLISIFTDSDHPVDGCECENCMAIRGAMDALEKAGVPVISVKSEEEIEEIARQWNELKCGNLRGVQA